MSMPLGARRLLNADGKTSMADLPPEILQHICSLLHDPDDVANCHLVDTRFCAAARAILHSALPQHPGFLQLALRHRYPLRHLDTAELPYCDLGWYLAKAPSSLTSLHIAPRTLQEHPEWSEEYQGPPPMANLLQSISSLRSLSCTLWEDNLGSLQPQQAGLIRLSLHIVGHHRSFRTSGGSKVSGLAHLTNLTRLRICTRDAFDWCQPLSVIAGLTTLQCLCLSTLLDPSPLSALRHLTVLALDKDQAWRFEDVESSEADEHIAALVQAIPQLRALKLLKYATNSATDAGLGQLSRLRELQHLSLEDSFAGCTLVGLGAALATMTDLQALHLSDCAFVRNGGLALIAQHTRLTTLFVQQQCTHPGPDTSATWDMVKALGPRLQHLTALYCADRITGQPISAGSSLDLEMLRHCPLLASVLLVDLQPGQAAQEMVHTSYEQCTQMRLFCPARPEASLLPCFPGLRRLDLCVGYKEEHADYKVQEYRLAPIIRGLRCLVNLRRLSIEMKVIWSGPLLGMLEAVASCSRLTSLQLADKYHDPCCQLDNESWAIGVSHLRALAALPSLKMLGLHCLPWTGGAVSLGLAWLVAQLPRLRVLDAWPEMLNTKSTSHLDGDTSVASYELWDLPGRRLRRWPRDASGHPGDTWPVLEQHRWPWDD